MRIFSNILNSVSQSFKIESVTNKIESKIGEIFLIFLYVQVFGAYITGPKQFKPRKVAAVAW